MEKYPNVNWAEGVKPLLKKYKSEKHPLAYKNTYQLIVMVVLSAQDSDKHINKIAPTLFEAFPNMAALSNTTDKNLHAHISDVRNSDKKTQWLLQIAQTIKDDKNITYTLDTLTALPGIGRKSANVILRESGKEPEGIMVDLHTVRVAPRLGIASGTDPKKIEKQMMDALQKSEWDAGMAMSFLGREICRPTPKCEECLMKPVCKYYNEVVHPAG